jgi:hypothetical protein
MMGMKFHENEQAHTQALTYRFKPGDKLTNSLVAFAAMEQSDLIGEVPSASPAAALSGGIGIKSTPYIFGLKDTVTFDWWEEHALLRLSGGVQYYWFKTDGNTIKTTSNNVNINTPNGISYIELGDTYKNLTVQGYADNRFNFGGFTFTPGVAFNYLDRTGKYVIDPRGMASYTFPSKTTIGVAGGQYSMFIQTMSTLFTQIPSLTSLDLAPMRGLHRSVSVEQEIKIFTFKLEGYYNKLKDSFWEDSYQTSSGAYEGTYITKGREEMRGIEFSVKINNDEDEGFYGYASYTYNNSKYKSNQSAYYSSYYPEGYPPVNTLTPSSGSDTPPPGPLSYGDKWIRGDYDMTHVVKLVAGYTFGKNTVSSKFQFNTSLPYKKIVSSYKDPHYLNPTRERHVPLYGKPNTERLLPEYRLDVRYSRKTNYKWGYVSWYLEVIGILNSPSKEYLWDYREQYGTDNPKVKDMGGGVSLIPNFGIETKF